MTPSLTVREKELGQLNRPHRSLCNDANKGILYVTEQRGNTVSMFSSNSKFWGYIDEQC